MVKNILRRANAKISVGAAAGLLSAAYFASALLGLFRDRLLVAKFGIGHTLDAYFVAFSIPDLIFFTLVSGALTVTFLPILTDRLVNYNKKSAWELSSSLLNFLSLITFVASILIFAFADPLMWLAGPGFNQETHDLAVTLTRILSLNPLLFSISSVFGTMQQAFGRFFFFAIAPVIYNLGIILGTLFLGPTMGIKGVVIGAVGGAVAQMLIQLIGLVGVGFEYRPQISWKNKGFLKVLKLIPARSLDEGMDHLNAMVERAIASHLSTTAVVAGLSGGAIAAYQYAFTLKNVPITLIGIAIATAVFPQMTERAAQARPDLLKSELSRTIEVMLWLSIPAAVLAFLMRGYLVRLLTGEGYPIIASILAWFAVAIVFQSLLRLISRVFYAYQDTKRPLYVSIFAVILNIVLAISFVKLFGLIGLPIAQSAVAIIEVAILLALLHRRIGRYISRKLMVAIAKITGASICMGAVTYLLIHFVFPLFRNDVGFFSLAPKFGVIVAISLLSYVLFSYLLKIEEAFVVVRRLMGFIFKRITVE